MNPRPRRGDDPRLRSPWYRDGAYMNLEEVAQSAARAAYTFLRWRLSPAERPQLHDAPDTPAPVRPLDPADLAPPAHGLKIAWLGHGSVYVAAPGASLVVDPLFGAPPLVRRLTPPPIPADRFPATDAVLITHNHYDHLDRASIVAIRERSPALRAVVPSGLATFVQRLGIADARALEWWEACDLPGGVRITAAPAHHWSARGPLDARQSHWCGYVVEAAGRRIFIAGDTAMARHFDLIARRFPEFDAAILPIGAYSPRWFMRDRHMDPPEAVAAAKTLRAKVLLPVHWGTLKLTDEPLGEPPLYAARAAEVAGQPIRIWNPGDVHVL